MVTLFAQALALATLSTATWRGQLPLPAHCQQAASFIGFSANEKAYAERLDITCQPTPSSTDHFALAVLVDLKNGQIAAVFRLGSPSRSRGPHLPVATSAASWSANYPLWQRALPAAMWHKTAKLGKFSSLQHDFADDVVRFRPEEGTRLHVSQKGSALSISGEPGAPLGCDVVVRLMDGSLIDVAHLHQARGSKTRVQLHFASDGRHVAVAFDNTVTGQRSLVVASEALKSPIDSPRIGAVNVMVWENNHANALYDELHPYKTEQWQSFLGGI